MVAETVGVNDADTVLPVVDAIPTPVQVYDAVPAPPEGVAVSTSEPPVQIELLELETETEGCTPRVNKPDVPTGTVQPAEPK